jgi:hypothetical protein
VPISLLPQVPVSINVLDEIVTALFNGSSDAEVEVDVFAAAETEVSMREIAALLLLVSVLRGFVRFCLHTAQFFVLLKTLPLCRRWTSWCPKSSRPLS